jgi:hypothetical protein
MLPIKAAVRRAIAKEAGDTVAFAWSGGSTTKSTECSGLANVDEPEHPVIQIVVSIHANRRIAARLHETKLDLRPGGRRHRLFQKHTRDVLDLG